LRVLLDTHTLLWWFYDAESLTQKARGILGNTDNTVMVSSASAWELAIKLRAGKLPAAAQVVFDFSSLLDQAGFQLLTISAEHAIRAGLLPGPHKDPFDRMLIAQAQAESAPIVSSDAIFDSYGVYRLW